MRNDITRDTFDRAKQFSRVLLQQGRVQLDADFNEQVSILLDYLRVLTVDLIGPSAGPEKAWGFALLCSDNDINALNLPAAETKNLVDRRKNEKVLIGPGRYYVDGLLAQNNDFTHFRPKVIKDVLDAKTVVVYLDVWERHITALEDDSIREKALNGPDTATRAKIEWSVRTRHIDDDFRGPDLPGAIQPNASEWLPQKFAAWREKQWANRPLLRAGIEQLEESDDPCVSSPESVYRGLENQLYRVEIHRPGPGAVRGVTAPTNVATFKWSRDNGSVVASWLADHEGAMKVAGVRDHARGFAAGQWVELSDDQYDLDGTPGTLVQLKDTEAGSLTIDPDTAAPGSVLSHDNYKGGNPKVRRWDQEETEEIAFTAGAIAIEYDTWFTLEDGVQIQFPAPAATVIGVPEHEFSSGDYWLIPARTATRDIEWPRETSDKTKRKARPPHGIRHHYGLLGVLAGEGDVFGFNDLRSYFTHVPLLQVPWSP
jgi:hypothetical protein